MCKTDCPGVVRGPDGEVVGPAGPAWIGRNKPHRGDRRWVQGWSPEQISKRLKVDFADHESMRISHEAIYQALYIEGRGALKRELVACLRTGRALRVPTCPGTAQSVGPCHARGDDQRTPGRDRGPGSGGSLGRRPADRVGAFSYRDPGRAHYPVHDADPPATRGRLRRHRTDQERTPLLPAMGRSR